jgi:hypothetical protein
MAFFTIATIIVGAIGLTGVVATIATSLIAAGLSIGVSKLVGARGAGGNSQQEDAVSGGRVQLPPATNNKLPVVYGTAFIGGSIIDAKISTDLQTMWYVIALAEVTNTMPGDTPDTITFDQIYYDNKLAALSGASVTSLTTNTAGTPEVDTKINGKLFIYLFPNGSSSGTNTGGQTAIQIMSDNDIPADQRWNQGIYTAGGQSAAMTNTAFVIVKVKFNDDAGTTSIGTVTAKMTNSRTKPGDCVKDYLLNDRYGCGVPLSSINTASLTALNDYSDKPIVYTPMGGGAPTTQVRYRFNGPLDTTKNCLAILQEMVDACDSWMQYSELTGQWKVVINKAYDESPDAVTFDDLYSVTNNNLTSGIQVNPTDLNQTYNQVEYQYPNTNIKDQLDFIFIALQDDFPSLLSENEPLNKLTINNDLVNNYVQAKFIAIRRILQAREDLIITLQTDYSGIQVEAGDVIKVTNEVYGWTNKLFRVSNVIEEKDAEGNLFAKLTGFEYNGSIYDDDLDITDFIPEDNTGLQDPNIIDQPDAPTVELIEASSIYSLNVTGVVPGGGIVRYLEFNYGTNSNSTTHLFKSTATNSNGAPLLANTSYTVNVNDIADPGNLYWSVTAKNDQVGIRSNSSAIVSWPGSNVSIANTFTSNNANSSGNIITTPPITDNIVGGIITIDSGTGNLAANTVITTIISNTQFTVNPTPTVALVNASINIQVGGIGTINLQPNSVTYNILAPGAAQEKLGGYSYEISDRFANTVTLPININTFSTFIKTENFGVPKYNTTTYSAGGGLYPYAQGNATTAIGYVANSTAAFTPADSSALGIYNGDLNWWVLEYDTVSSNVSPGETLAISVTTQVTATSNVVIQLAGFVTFTANGQYMVCDTDSHLFTYNLYAGQPTNIDAEIGIIGNTTIDGGGFLIRNMSSSNVFTGGTQLQLTKSKNQ